MLVWNIFNWVVQLLAPILRKSKLMAWSKVIVEPVKVMYDEFVLYRLMMIKKLRLNGQTIIMENLLNDLFDETDRGITIETAFDIVPAVYISQPGAEFATAPIYVGQHFEPPPVYLGQPSEYGVNYDFIVTVPLGILTSNQETQLKYIVFKYKLLSKKPFFVYDDSTPF
jgi:hypothetical protein